MDSTENTKASPVPEASPVPTDPEAPLQRCAADIVMAGAAIVAAAAEVWSVVKDDSPQQQMNVEQMNVTINNGTPDE